MEKTDNNLKKKKKERKIRKRKGREKEFNSYLFVPFLLVCCDIIKVLKKIQGEVEMRYYYHTYGCLEIT